MYEIRELKPPDTDAFIRLRREALESEPLAFGASLADDRGLDVEFVREALGATDGRAVLGAFDPELMGIGGIYPDPHKKSAHRMHIRGMYVRADRRDSGVGAALLQPLTAHASRFEGVRQVHLSVSETAEPARRLYERHGFRVWGTEPSALEHAGTVVALHHLVLVLKS